MYSKLIIIIIIKTYLNLTFFSFCFRFFPISWTLFFICGFLRILFSIYSFSCSVPCSAFAAGLSFLDSSSQSPTGNILGSHSQLLLKAAGVSLSSLGKPSFDHILLNPSTLNTWSLHCSRTFFSWLLCCSLTGSPCSVAPAGSTFPIVSLADCKGGANTGHL